MATECPVSTGPSTAVQLVEGGWDQWSGFADQAFKDAQALVSELGEFTSQPINVNVTFPVPGDLGAPFAKPTAPTDPDVTFGSVDGPGTLSIPTITAPDFGTAPIDTTVAPSLNIPQAPDALSGQAPDNAPTISDVVIPDAPALVIPDAPTLRDIDLPSAPTITLPTFSGTVPTADFVAPGDTFTFTEADYSSAELTAIQARVTEMLAGGTGLPDVIWNQIWDRARTNEIVAAQGTIRKATETWAARGFSLPPGALNATILETQQQVQNAQSKLNREIAIQQAQMEVENLKFAVTQGIALETMLIGLHSGTVQRALQASQFAFDSTVNVFNAKVALFGAELNSYTAQASAFRELVQAELANIEIFRAELEGQRIIGDINRQDVEIYTARINALNTQVDLHRSQVQSVQAQVDVDKTRIDSFRALVEAYGEKVRAKQSEFAAYGEQVKGELAKTEIFKAETDAFATRVDAYKAGTDALTSQSRLEIDNNDLQLREFGTRVDKYKADLQGEINRVNAGVNVYDGKTRLFAAELSAEQARVISDTRQFELALEQGRTQAGIELKQADANISQVERLLALEQRSKEMVAQVQSQLAASAMSAVSLSAGISNSDATSKSCSTSYSHTFKEK